MNAVPPKAAQKVTDFVLKGGQVQQRDAAGRRLDMNELNNEEVELAFVVDGIAVDVKIPRAPGVLAKDAKIHIVTPSGTEEVSAADYEIDTYRSSVASATFLDGELDAVVVAKSHTLQVTKTKDDNHLEILDVTHLVGDCGVGEHEEVDHAHVVGKIRAHADDAKVIKKSLRSVEKVRSERSDVPKPRRLSGKPELWTDCYTGDDVMHRFNIGIDFSPNAYMRKGQSTVEGSMREIQKIVSQANLIYQNQMNIILTVADAVLHTSHENLPAHFQPLDCTVDIADQLNAYTAAPQQSTQGLWHILEGCQLNAAGGTLGVAWTSGLCHASGYNTGVNWWSLSTWTTFAHEVGHNFGANHSFEEGQGETGGIMDYGDAMLDGIYQFNTKYRKDEICATIESQAVTCAAMEVAHASCGNGVIEFGEDCECVEGLSCACCESCQWLDVSNVCTPEGYPGHGDCCTEQCQYQPRGTACGGSAYYQGTTTQVSGTRGYCDATATCHEAAMCSVGVMVENYGFEGYCSLELDTASSCQAMCIVDGACAKTTYRTDDKGVHDITGGTCTGDFGQGVCLAGVCSPDLSTDDDTPMHDDKPMNDDTRDDDLHSTTTLMDRWITAERISISHNKGMKECKGWHRPMGHFDMIGMGVGYPSSDSNGFPSSEAYVGGILYALPGPVEDMLDGSVALRISEKGGSAYGKHMQQEKLLRNDHTPISPYNTYSYDEFYSIIIEHHPDFKGGSPKELREQLHLPPTAGIAFTLFDPMERKQKAHQTTDRIRFEIHNVNNGHMMACTRFA